MSPGQKATHGKSALGRSVIVLAGEDSNDRKVVRELISELCPGLGSKLIEIRDSVRLKAATPGKLDERVRVLVGKAKAGAARERAALSGIVVHEDLDAVTGTEYAVTRQRLRTAFERQAPCPSAVALAAWETEAWLLLFPEAFAAVRAGWKVPTSLIGRDTGKLRNPKEELHRRLGSPRYRESDAVEIMRAARQQGLMRKPITGSNGSYEDFVADLKPWSQ
ncbi:hypothetical protein H7827_10590 [Streptomyces sp. JH002]|uniref:hypothetical protein n=1 Tax=Streptomyces sp. JH002 TaxID=2763259 RepID=UPI003D8041BE